MSRPSTPSLAADLKEVRAFFVDRHVIPASLPDPLIENVRKIHAATYSLILWRFRLKGIPAHGRPFLEEIASDALQILPQVLMGYSKTAVLLTRGIIENTLRHLYFFDHPIEFRKMNRETKWFLRMVDLFDYAKTHPALIESQKRFDAVDRLSNLYSDLSSGVHGRAVMDLEMRIALDKIVCSAALAKKHADLIERCASAANFLIAVLHGQKMARFQPEDRLIILQTMPRQARRAWRESL